MNSKNTCEFIESCAVSLSNGKIVTLPKPARHHHIVHMDRSYIDGEQGFVTDTGRFVSREEALVIARNANQIIKRCGGDEKRLYSENLW